MATRSSAYADPLIGVLGLQGAFDKHRQILERCGARAIIVRREEELARADALIIPGGESTTVNTLFDRTGLAQPIRERAKAGMPMLGTCMGMIVMARTIHGLDQPSLGLLDIVVERNAFGRQVESFEADLDIPVVGEKPFRGVFIRAPIVRSAGPECEPLCEYEGRIVMVRQGHLLGTAFHPELTADRRIHELFLEML
jgi:5'-phosphate synthase pdxT subunit